MWRHNFAIIKAALIWNYIFTWNLSHMDSLSTKIVYFNKIYKTENL